MRIVTWNCCWGCTWGAACQVRAACLNRFSPVDLVVLQECGPPPGGNDPHCVWFPNNGNQRLGVGVLAANGFTVQPGPVDPNITHSTYPIRACGPHHVINLLAVWAQNDPTYVEAIMHGLTAYSSFLTEQDIPAMVVGDFNSHAMWNAQNPAANHTILVERLRVEFGLASAYHSHHGLPEAPLLLEDHPTFYHNFQLHQPFHIDYCFIPKEWAKPDCLRGVQVGSYNEWVDLCVGICRSDHCPLVVDLAV